MRTVYIADDGKEFDNEFDCEHHEWMLNHPNLKYIKIYDNRTGELFDDIMTDDAYNYGDIETWKGKHDREVHGLTECNKIIGGAIGDRYTFEFIPTTIGIIGTIKCGSCGEKFTFRELM